MMTVPLDYCLRSHKKPNLCLSIDLIADSLCLRAKKVASRKKKKKKISNYL